MRLMRTANFDLDISPLFSLISSLDREEWDEDKARSFFFMRMSYIHSHSFCEARKVAIKEPYIITLITDADFFETFKRQRHS